MPERKGPPGPGWRARLAPLGNVAVVLALLLAVYLLPPDTSLAELRRVGVLRVCVSPDYPPLVAAASTERPGVEVEILREVAARMDLRLALNVNATQGRDVNPRNWRLTRAQCQIVAGGVIATPTTRSYLDTTRTYFELGWAIIDPGTEEQTLEGARVGFHAGLSGFDRIALSQYLRGRGATISVVNSRQALRAGLADGTFDFGVTESLGAGEIAAQEDWLVAWLSDDLARLPVAFGLWKGDLTIKRELEGIMRDLEAEGVIEAIFDRYQLPDIETVFGTPEAEAAVEQLSGADG